MEPVPPIDEPDITNRSTSASRSSVTTASLTIHASKVVSAVLSGTTGSLDQFAELLHDPDATVERHSATIVAARTGPGRAKAIMPQPRAREESRGIFGKSGSGAFPATAPA